MENNRAKILWDFQIQMNSQVLANQSDIVVCGCDSKFGRVAPTDPRHNIRVLGKSVVVGTAKIVHRSLKLPVISGRGFEIEEDTFYT